MGVGVEMEDGLWEGLFLKTLPLRRGQAREHNKWEYAP